MSGLYYNEITYFLSYILKRRITSDAVEPSVKVGPIHSVTSANLLSNLELHFYSFYFVKHLNVLN